MFYPQTKLPGFILLVTLVSVVAACGDTDTRARFSSNWVYCDRPDVAEPSCSLDGYSMTDDSELRMKLAGCASSECHGGGPESATNWVLDLSGSVEDGLAALNHSADDSLFNLVDGVDPDCSQVLAEVSERPFGAVRMPVLGGFWSAAEVDCFRSYLHDMTN